MGNDAEVEASVLPPQPDLAAAWMAASAIRTSFNRVCKALVSETPCSLETAPRISSSCICNDKTTSSEVAVCGLGVVREGLRPSLASSMVSSVVLPSLAPIAVVGEGGQLLVHEAGRVMSHALQPGMFFLLGGISSVSHGLNFSLSP
ncbi:hypothetical protein E2562_004870 [Oryza meyeriana var. granulata]|uniref:Uncharacterized protein n=1 Tax=Oryza meyeriana var. granulata TaxID=110450 RepID=A0A6G1C3Q1_9ORYZ|nr:hypothetical protein E2562_004870 [Oryza meyeriana var. granulata]